MDRQLHSSLSRGSLNHSPGVCWPTRRNRLNKTRRDVPKPVETYLLPPESRLFSFCMENENIY